MSVLNVARVTGAEPGTAGARARFLEFCLRWAFLLLPLASAWASTVTLGPIVPVRALAAVLVVLVVACRDRMSSVAWSVVLVGALWLVWGVFLARPGTGYRELLGVGIGLATMVAMTMAAKDASWLVRLCRSWLIGMIIVCLPAFFEVATGIHMPNYREGSSEYVRSRATDIASFMVNPNLFAYFLIVGMGVMIVGWRLETGRLRHLYFLFALIAPVLVLLTGSRLCLAAVALLFVWMLLLSRPLTLTVAAVGVLGAGLIVVTGRLHRLLRVVDTALFNLGSLSGRSRLHVYQDALWMFADKHGLGQGPGQFTIRLEYAPWPTYTTVDPHSGFTEVFVGYGLLVGSLIVALALATLVRAVRRDWRAASRRRPRAAAESLLLQGVVLLLAVSPLLAMANSSYLKSPVVWCHMGTVAIWCQALLEARRWRLREDLKTVVTAPGQAGRGLPRRYRIARRAAASRAAARGHE
ncbi:O-antigen ligase family protein [Acidipropionibacterium virtanenii]|uniref:Teichuronic acid biosynthesis protein TuaE n=1 Tax=Acidipropionibacterium virtanenii TaxID=2057246 RepID=A0A344UXI8_9ACTN|nr:O-antigen ligase family protein [Acidipropionibacterium virtanenii]AXE39986.1 Teichuronic acid biosynthesis protein TuaE [Acidipropionibacterium virtanenii]